jgi:hypothetical protein
MNNPCAEPEPKRAWLGGVARAAIAAAAGVMLFFTFGAAPSLFEVYPRRMAGEITGVLFAAYYHFLYTALGIAALALVLSARALRRARATLVLVLFALALVATVDLAIGPRLDGLRGPANRAAFGRLHGIAMILNLAALSALGVACALPRTHVSRAGTHAGPAGTGCGP